MPVESLRSDLISGNFPCVLMSVAEQLPSRKICVLYVTDDGYDDSSAVESRVVRPLGAPVPLQCSHTHPNTHKHSHTSVDVVLQVNPVKLTGECQPWSRVWNTVPQLKHTDAHTKLYMQHLHAAHIRNLYHTNSIEHIYVGATTLA